MLIVIGGEVVKRTNERKEKENEKKEQQQMKISEFFLISLIVANRKYVEHRQREKESESEKESVTRTKRNHEFYEFRVFLFSTLGCVSCVNIHHLFFYLIRYN